MIREARVQAIGSGMGAPRVQAPPEVLPVIRRHWEAFPAVLLPM
jgi:hypothetical protein